MSWYLIGIIAGLAAVGGLKGTQLLLGPTNVIVMGVGLAALPESARNLAQSTTSLRHTMVAITSVSATSVLAWGALLFFLPESVGRQLLGATWGEARSLLGPMIIAFTFGAAAIGARSGLLALAESRRILITGAIEGSSSLASCLLARRGGVLWRSNCLCGRNSSRMCSVVVSSFEGTSKTPPDRIQWSSYRPCAGDRPYMSGQANERQMESE